MSRKLRYFVLIALLSLGIASSMQALPEHGFWVIYYSDATMTDVVGGREYWCSGGIDSWGQRTGFSYGEDWDCHQEWDHSCWVCVDYECGEVMCGV